MREFFDDFFHDFDAVFSCCVVPFFENIMRLDSALLWRMSLMYPSRRSLNIGGRTDLQDWVVSLFLVTSQNYNRRFPRLVCVSVDIWVSFTPKFTIFILYHVAEVKLARTKR